MSTPDRAAAEPVPLGRSERIHAAILSAAEEVFLRDGYVGASMVAQP